jgi:hypothetical protein
MRALTKINNSNGVIMRLFFTLLTVAVMVCILSCKKTTEPTVTTEIEISGSWTGTDATGTSPVNVKYTFLNNYVSLDYGNIMRYGKVAEYNNGTNTLITEWTAYPDSLTRYQKFTWTENRFSSLNLQSYVEKKTVAEATSTTDMGGISPITVSKIGTGPAQLVKIQGGTFSNGIANITVSDFYMDKYEVTQNSYKTVMGVNPATFTNSISNPVEKVSWFDAIEYCNRRSIQEGFTPCYSYDGVANTNPASWPNTWNTNFNNHSKVACNWTANGYRLPTEMEWMFAARGGRLTHSYSYSGSDYIEYVAWYNINSTAKTHSVASLMGNELGLYDMNGNVFEWTWDIYGIYTTGAQTNPTGALDDSLRVLRGGSWASGVGHCTPSFRSNNKADVKSSMIGFRVCRISI